MQRPLAVHLLGTPTVRCASAEQPAPRGRKAWALLAYLLTTDAAPSRQWLAELLFTEAEDLLNALSWNLGQLRLLLALVGRQGGCPVHDGNSSDASKNSPKWISDRHR